MTTKPTPQPEPPSDFKWYHFLQLLWYVTSRIAMAGFGLMLAGLVLGLVIRGA